MSLIFYLQEKHYLGNLDEFFEKYKESPCKGPMCLNDQRANCQYEYWWPSYVEKVTRDKRKKVAECCDQVVFAITVIIVATAIGKLVPASLPQATIAAGLCAVWGLLNYMDGWLSLATFKGFAADYKSFAEYAHAKVDELQTEEARAWDRKHYCACAAPKDCDKECSG